MASIRRLSNRQQGMTKQQAGQRGGHRGGQQRARTLSTHQRQGIARKGGRAKNR